ncbi:MAG: DNA/RNA nuclease SfsA [Thermosipho sp. (in: Bacteria)]|nr:DNA/RNA nuclease SfsA [Thermosipho sp. (in: thermotogales)]
MNIFKIPFTHKGKFLERINKYVGLVELSNKELALVHIHDPGRLIELIFPGNEVLLKYISNPNRKTSYDLIAAKKQNEWVLVNSIYHRKIAEKLLNSGMIINDKILSIKPEIIFKNSRLDFYVKTKNFSFLIEVKGCTLSKNKIALFPDAPTKRGLKHLNELIEAQKLGFKTTLLILVFARSKCFSPNFEIDPKFSKTLLDAIQHKIEMIPVQLFYSLEDQYIKFIKILPFCNY